MGNITRIPAPAYPDESTPLSLTEAEKNSCSIAADQLFSAFNWDQSAEGNKFWDGVHRRLRRLSKGEPLK